MPPSLRRIQNKMVADETKIKSVKQFYSAYLIKVLDKKSAIIYLKTALEEFKKEGPHKVIPFTKERTSAFLAERQLRNYLNEYVSSEIAKQFDRSFEPKIVETSQSELDKTFFGSIWKIYREGSNALKESGEQQFNYRINLITFIIECLSCGGLHPTIKFRDELEFKRYIVVASPRIDMGFLDEFEVLKLISYSELNDQILSPYLHRTPVVINGRLLDFSKKGRLQIFSTLLKDDEIEILATNHNFSFDKDMAHFAFKHCKEETNTLLKNPHLIELKRKKLKSRNEIPYIEIGYIEDLKKIKSKTFGLKKLIRLCEEINSAAQNENYITLAILQRAFIDYVPPIFNYKKFSDIIQNYNAAGKSFREAMIKLEPMRKIADLHIHNNAQKDDLIPTFNQVNFSQPLDLLISEIIKILRNTPQS